METIRKIRLAARDGKKSIRQIAKDFNVSRNTVRKVLRSDQTRFEYHRDTIHRPKLGPFVDTLASLLKNDQPLPLKQRLLELDPCHKVFLQSEDRFSAVSCTNTRSVPGL